MPSQSYDNQVGPGVEGKGFITIYTNGRTAVLHYSPADPSKSRVRYSSDPGRPDTPMPIREDVEVRGLDKVTIEYQVRTEGDIKIAWNILP